MTGTPSENTPLAGLVRFMAGIAIAGIILAGIVMITAPSGPKTLTPPANSETGGIQVWTNPGSAYVSVQPTSGGMAYGGWTTTAGSYTLRDVPAYMTYDITVTKTGYLPAATTLYVQPGIIAEANLVLQEDTPDTGSLDIRVIPYGGTVCIDGTHCETYDPDPAGELSRTVDDLDGDAYHTVSVRMDGYYGVSREVWVPAGETTKVSITMSKK